MLGLVRLAIFADDKLAYHILDGTVRDRETKSKKDN